jgi:hypothetical protein
MTQLCASKQLISLGGLGLHRARTFDSLTRDFRIVDLSKPQGVYPGLGRSRVNRPANSSQMAYVLSLQLFLGRSVVCAVRVPGLTANRLLRQPAIFPGRLQYSWATRRNSYCQARSGCLWLSKQHPRLRTVCDSETS